MLDFEVEDSEAPSTLRVRNRIFGGVPVDISNWEL